MTCSIGAPIVLNDTMSRTKKLQQTAFALPPELLTALVVLSKRTRIPQAAYIREGLAIVLKKYVHMLGESVPADLDAYAEPAHINAHNALAWAGEQKMPVDEGQAQAPAIVEGDG